MTRVFGKAPSTAEIETMAHAALARLPAQFRAHLQDIVLQVEELADDALLDDMGLENAFDLTGVYEGIPVGQRSIDHLGILPDRIRLFRLPILLEWCEHADETLEHLVAHVLIHEIGHHFGLSDEDMHMLEELAG